jgi:DNA polymerase-3 subunit delta'
LRLILASSAGTDLRILSAEMSLARLESSTHVVALLQRSLDRGRVAHAYLLTADAPEELEALGLNFAKTLNCQNPPRRGAGGLALDCCDHCSSCNRINSGNHPDLEIIRPESKTRVIRIHQITRREESKGRTLTEFAALKPTEAAWKIGIIVAADRMNEQAANSFLKTLEEPPPRTVFLLLSTEPERVLETIQSRCLRLHSPGEGGSRIARMHGAWVADFLRTAAGTQKSLMSRYRLLDALLARLGTLKDSVRGGLAARSPLEQYPDAEAGLREKWEDELDAAAEAEYRRQRADVLLALQLALRDVWLRTLGGAPVGLSYPDCEPQTAALAGRLTPDAAAENLRVLEATQRLLFTNVQEPLALEVGLLKLKL